MTDPAPTPVNGLARAASVAMVAGALGSLGLMLSAARNTPALLIFLYAGWVMLPFVGLAIGRRRMTQRGAVAERTMNTAALVVAVTALVVYVLALVMPNSPRPAAVFLMGPLACNVFIGVVYSVAAAQARRASSPQS